MTDDNSNTELVDIPENLSDFKLAFESKEEPVEDSVEDNEDDALANDDDTDASAKTEDDAEADEADADGDEGDPDGEADEEPEAEEKPKRKSNNYQTRINELTRARHEAERREAALIARLEALEKGPAQPVSQPTPSKATLPQGAPDPEAKNEDGTDKYPLGVFDPDFIFDLNSFTVDQRIAARDKEAADKYAAQQLANAQNELRANWSQKVDAVEEEIPEIREHIGSLVDTFSNIQPEYGEYLATTIMQMDNGPAIMEYLSQNIGEAQKIVASGPHAATISIGRLDAVLSKPVRSKEKDVSNKKPSEAPPPPVAVTRGSKNKSEVRPDTENLADFKRAFMSGKK